ncbi:hypothetical protein [Jannaschia sp. LMIT008]|uniref:hypothetical protein n=1 Tax=Jannaschia maritima TaxID=3032585 RepID=UPI00281265E3|nr:hypothetical protein [Jannaschia sp. LMIT008]
MTRNGGTATAGGGPGDPEWDASFCIALSDEALDLTSQLRSLQDDLSEIPGTMIPDHMVQTAQALDRVCQTLEDMSAIFARLAHAPPLADAVAVASQETLRHRLLSPMERSGALDTGAVELF